MRYDYTRHAEDTALVAETSGFINGKQLIPYREGSLASHPFMCALCRTPINPHEAFWWLQRGGLVDTRLEFLPFHPACSQEDTP